MEKAENADYGDIDLTNSANVSYREVPDGKEGTVIGAVEAMRMAVGGSIDYSIISLSQSICKNYQCDPNNPEDKARAIFHWVKANISYQRDPLPAEMLQTPQRLLKSKAGDCDDMSILIGALLLAVGVNVRFVLMSIVRNKVRSWHIYPEAKTKKGWFSLDASYSESFPGWQPPEFEQKIIINTNLKAQQINGLFSDVFDFLKEMWADPFKFLQDMNVLALFENLQERKKFIRDMKRLRDKLVSLIQEEHVRLFGLLGKDAALKSLIPLQRELEEKIKARKAENALQVKAFEDEQRKESVARLKGTASAMSEALFIYAEAKNVKVKEIGGDG